MPVLSTATSAGPYVGNGATTVFPFSFAARGTDEVAVVADGVTLSSLLYIVALTDSGGSVTFTTPPVASAIYINSNPDFTQETLLENHAAFLPDVIGTALDRAAIRDLYLLGKVEQAESILDTLLVGLDPVALPAVPGVLNITSMAALPPPSDGALLIVAGYTTPGDGGGGTFRWSASSAAVSDGGTIFAASSGGVGRWLRIIEGPWYVDWFGAKGDCTSGLTPTGTDDRAAIQAAIDAASAASSIQTGLGDGTVLNSPARQIELRFRSKSYLVNGGLTLASATNGQHCTIWGEGQAELVQPASATAALFHIGNSSSFGICAARVSYLHLRRPDAASGSVGLWVQHASNGRYLGITSSGFEKAIFCDGSIGCIFDGDGRVLGNGSTTAFYAQSSVNGSPLRFADNNLYVAHYEMQGVNGFVLTAGPGVTLSNGGNIVLEKLDFEGVTGWSLSISAAGETNLGTVVMVNNCWFEGYGSTLASISNSQVRFTGGFIANIPAGGKVFELLDDTSTLHLDGLCGYFGDSAAGSYIVSLGGSATAAAYSNVLITRVRLDGLRLLNAAYPNNDLGVDVDGTRYSVLYNAAYPAGNNVQNNGLVVSLFTEADSILGTGWNICEVTFQGTDGVSFGHTVLRLHKYGAVRAVKDEDGNGVRYTLANLSAGTASITFDGTAGHWYSMTGTYRRLR